MLTSNILLGTFIALLAQSFSGGNVLVNGDARRGPDGWMPAGQATIEYVSGVPCFTVRGRGSFRQEVVLHAEAAGAYAVLVGRGQSERINADGAITGLPYLYALVATPDRKRFLAHWQGQEMRARPEQPGDWVTMWGIFKIPEGAAFVYVQLNQAERRGVPQDGSAARFADVRMQIFPTEAAARAFVKRYP